MGHEAKFAMGHRVKFVVAQDHPRTPRMGSVKAHVGLTIRRRSSVHTVALNGLVFLEKRVFVYAIQATD